MDELRQRLGFVRDLVLHEANGELILEGVVRSWYYKGLAQEEAMRMFPDKRLVNKIRVA